MFANCRSLGVNAVRQGFNGPSAAAIAQLFELEGWTAPKFHDYVRLNKIKKTHPNKRGVGDREARVYSSCCRAPGAVAPGFVLSDHAHGQIKPC